MCSCDPSAPCFVQQCNVTWRMWQSQCIDSTFSVTAQALPHNALYLD